MNREAIPTEFPVVDVELEGLLNAVDRLEADVANAVLTHFTITAEVDGVHVLEQGGLELGFALAGLLHQLGIHHELVFAEDRVHLEAA